MSWPSFGLFEIFYADLGRDFRSHQVRAVCHDLSINIVHTRGYHGKSKPIERWFGVMENDLRHLPGYCGNKPENNPERQRLKPAPLDPKALLTLDQFEAALRDYIVNVFHHAESDALGGLSPLAALQAHVERGFSVREVRDERALDLLLMRRRGAPLKVRNFGVQLFGRAYMAPELLSIVGQEVETLWDPSALGEIYLYRNNHFLCVARNRELIDFGASEETLKREREIKREQKRSVHERHQRLLDEAQYPDPLARAAAEERLDKVMDEERQKIAVGAEAQGTTVLLPKYAQAAKRLRSPESKVLSPERRKLGTQRSSLSTEKNPWLDDDEPKSGAALLKRERNEWLEDEET